ncbi:MAG TPA: beta-ketoacyl synthase N-terminal-like domain-containing protein, partial [Anaerolineales bacterium]|nr:beta-ketoacyl synthase N-terminal-like domain-containing protein [Anaerolineales bacterium]
MTSLPFRRVVVTGIGWVTPLGDTVDGVWEALVAGRSGIRHVDVDGTKGFPCRIAGALPDFRPDGRLPAKEARRMARVSQIALVAGQKAIEDARLPLPLAEPERAGVIMGTAIGGLDRADEGIQVLRSRGLDRVNPFFLPSALPNMPAFHITQQLGA